MNSGPHPLCVDIDGTLLRTDNLPEAVLVLVKTKPLSLLLMPFWLLQGRAKLKKEIADRAALAVETLPYHQEFLAFLQTEKKKGRHLILATASDVGFAKKIADHLKIFDGVVGSDGTVNRKGKRKLEQLKEFLGGKPFVYAGNHKVDLEVWRGAAGAIAVNTPASVIRKLKALGVPIERTFDDRVAVLPQLLKSMRMQQWVKNLLVFVPVFTAHQLLDAPTLTLAGLGFLSFCFASSSMYVLNDLLDMHADRQHPWKAQRPLASGNLSVLSGVVLMLLLLLASGWAAVQLTPTFSLIIGLYLLSTIAYSFAIKQLMFADVIMLGCLYTLRIVAGLVATEISFSVWLLAFSLFLFVSLALLKRFAELQLLKREGKQVAVGRAYTTDDAPILSQCGIASGYISILVFSLYLQSEQVTTLYTRPELLWLLCPLMLYAISRMWYIASKGKMHDDPIIFVLRDTVGFFLGLCVLMIVGLAS